MSTPGAPPPGPAPAAAPAPAPAPSPAGPTPAGAPGASGGTPGDGGTPPAGGDGQGGAQGDGGAQPGDTGGGDNVGAGSRARGATNRTGQGSLRAGTLREAWTHIGGDRVQGDKIVVQVRAGERDVVMRALSATTVETVRHAFQPPPRWDDVLADAWQRRSVVLRGPGGAGKTAAGVRLLIAAQVKTWYLLDSVAELSRLTDLRQLGSGAGLLLDRPPDLDGLSGSLLQGLEELLRLADARLVLIAGPEAELGRGASEYVRRIDRPGTLNTVLEAHLAHLLGELEAERALAAAGVGDLAAELLDDHAACRDAARLAEVLAHEHRAGAIDTDHVRTRMDRAGGESPEEWFEGLGDTVLRTQAVALAVLGGLPQEDVALAATLLLEWFRSERGILTPSVDQGPVPLRHDPFAQSRRLLAEKLRARTVAAVTRGALGRLPCTVAEYRDPAYPPRIIRHVWSEYRIQRELIGWLAELVDSPTQQVRSFAGTALGLIATEAFEYVANQVFAGWAMDEDNGWQRREAIGYALKVCARDPALRGGVRALVDGWYLSDVWQYQAAAARAYGLCLGGADLTAAVAALTRLGTVDNIQVAIAIGDSFADLLEEDLAAHALVVLRAVAEMAHTAESRACGHLVFLILADTLLSEDPATPGIAPRSCPTLLRLAAKDPSGGELRRLLGYLWAEVIGGELFGEEAASVLQKWAAQAENDPLLLDDLVRILVDDVAARSPRAGRLLERQVTHWNERDNFRPLPRSAAVLGTALRLRPPAPPDRPGGAR
ncbi:hypothetical protein ACOT81_33415 [Streptomyces sp. WI04-05B]|uniref:hypothetical protein n=1 Tax=Streptomyces TaxID=1883 RepID=UPI00299FD37B|nr:MULTISPECIES: hypothetical protein [unclassified Streptomyces]MDX2541763.1 hypothetical protein [Streptomyces sp. WI04-05B]MDX2586845.1 hypothetical protein [Streptomyces sp. WI04-05A]